MDLDIAERLACPRDHAPSALVVRADVTQGGALVSGAIGCPACHAEWIVRERVAFFGEPLAGAAEVFDPPGADALAAFLALTEPGMLVLADGVPDDACDALQRQFGARILALDAAAVRRRAGHVVGARRVPLAAGVARGAVLLRRGRSREFTQSAVHATVEGGRIVGGELPVPDAARVLAQGGPLWVGERVPIATPVRLRRR